MATVESEISLNNQSDFRVTWIDALKGLAILSVVLGHTLLGYAENKAFPESTNMFIYVFEKWIYTWHMPFFFAISGYTFALAYIKIESGKYIVKWKKVLKQSANLLLIFLIFQCALCGLKIIFASFVDNKMNASQIIMNIAFPDTLMWYLWVLIIYYLVCVILSMMKWDSHTILKCIIVTGVLLIMDLFQKATSDVICWRLCFRNLFHCAIYFWIGIILCRLRKIKSIIMSNKALIIEGIVIALYLTMFIFFHITSKNMENFICVIGEEINALSITILLFTWFESKKINTNILVNIGRMSLVIYLLHTYIVTALKVLFIRMNLCISILAPALIIVTWIIPVVVTYKIGLLSKRNKALGYIFNPISLIK